MRVEVHDRELWCQRLEKAEGTYRNKVKKALADLEEHKRLVAAYEAKPWWKRMFCYGYGGAPEHDGMFYVSTKIREGHHAQDRLEHLFDLRLSIINAHPEDVPHLDQYDLSLMGDYAHWTPTKEDECTP